MCRLRFVTPEEASNLTRDLFAKLIFVPNIFGIIANSETVITLFSSHYDNLHKYKLSAKYRKIISLAVSEFNHCRYCIALHTTNAIEAGLLTEEECLEARRMKSRDPETDVLLKFTKAVMEERGNVEDHTIEMMKHEGFDDQDIVEVIAIISLIIQANYVANVGMPELDFLEPVPV